MEIYRGGETPVKTVIGTSTQNHTGTYMVLADANGQLAEEPFIVHMEGFWILVNAIFDEREWRAGMFDYPGNSLRRVEVELTEAGGRLYAMEVDGVGTLLVEGAPLIVWIRCSGRTASIDFAVAETYSNHLTASRQFAEPRRAGFPPPSMGPRRVVPHEIELYWKAPISIPMTTTESSTNGMDRGCTPSTRTKPCSCSVRI